MYHVSTQGVDESMINVHYYYYHDYKIVKNSLMQTMLTAEGEGERERVLTAISWRYATLCSKALCPNFHL